MTQERKIKMLQIFGGSLAATIIAILTFVFAYGGQSKTINFNTERIKRVEYTVEKRFDKLDEHLERIEDMIRK